MLRSREQGVAAGGCGGRRSMGLGAAGCPGRRAEARASWSSGGRPPGRLSAAGQRGRTCRHDAMVTHVHLHSEVPGYLLRVSWGSEAAEVQRAQEGSPGKAFRWEWGVVSAPFQLCVIPHSASVGHRRHVGCDSSPHCHIPISLDVRLLPDAIYTLPHLILTYSIRKGALCDATGSQLVAGRLRSSDGASGTM